MTFVEDKILQIGNNEKVIEACEPHVAFPFQLQHWMVARTLYAIRLLLNEAKDDEIHNTKSSHN